MSIKRDLKIGKIGENIVRDFFVRYGCLVDIKQGKFQPYDMTVTHPEFGSCTIEIKYDLYSAKSGNLAFEYYNPRQDKPSGILATQADYWCHVLPDKTILIIPATKLKQYIKETTPTKTVYCGGDKNSSMLIYSLDIAKKWFEVLEHEAQIGELLKCES